MGFIKAGDGKVFDEFEQFVLDHCGGVSDQEATLKALREFTDKQHGGAKVADALKDRAGLVETINRLQADLNEAQNARHALAAKVAELQAKQTAPEPQEPPLPGGHGDPSAPPPPAEPAPAE